MKKLIGVLCLISSVSLAATLNLTNDYVFVRTPTNDCEAANKSFVIATAGGFVPGSTVDLGGGTLTNGLTIEATNVVAKTITLNGVTYTNLASGSITNGLVTASITNGLASPSVTNGLVTSAVTNGLEQADHAVNTYAPISVTIPAASNAAMAGATAAFAPISVTIPAASNAAMAGVAAAYVATGSTGVLRRIQSSYNGNPPLCDVIELGGLGVDLWPYDNNSDQIGYWAFWGRAEAYTSGLQPIWWIRPNIPGGSPRLDAYADLYCQSNLTVSGTITEGGTSLASKYASKTVSMPLTAISAVAGTNQFDYSGFTVDCGVYTQVVAYGSAATGSWYLVQWPEHTSMSVYRTGYVANATCSGTFATTGDVWTGTATITNGNVGMVVLAGNGGYPTNVMHWRGRGYQSVTF